MPTVTYSKEDREIIVDEGGALEDRLKKDGWTAVEPISLVEAKKELSEAEATERAAEAREAAKQPSNQAALEAAAKAAAAIKAKQNTTKMTK